MEEMSNNIFQSETTPVQFMVSDITASQTTTISRGSPSADDADFWSHRNICKHLDIVSDNHSIVTCRIDQFLPPFVFVIGLVSNVLVILVMRSKSFRSVSTSFYMTVNAVADFASILVALPAHYIFVNFPQMFNPVRDAHAMCAFFNVFGWGTSDLGVLFTVAMTTERAIAVSYPLKAHKLCTLRRAKFVVFGLIVFELVKVSHYMFKSRVVANTTRSLCDVDREDKVYAEFYDSVWLWLHSAILLASYLLVMAGNIVIIRSIRKSTSERVSPGVQGRKTARNDSARNRQLSIMLVIDSFSLVIFTFPFAIVNILIDFFNIVSDSEGGKNLTYTVTFYCLYVNRCLNFFLYCISGQRFRMALKGIFRSSAYSYSAGHMTSGNARNNASKIRSGDVSDASIPSDVSKTNGSVRKTPEIAVSTITITTVL